jgi:hypothetical protein
MTTQFEMPVATPVQPEVKEFLAGFQRVEAEVRAVADRDLVAVNLDVPSAVATALGALPEIVTLRDEVAALKGVDINKFDKIRDYALALAHTHGAYRAALGPADPIGKISEEVAEVREQLFADALALGRRGLLESGRVEKLRSGVGYKNVAFDVVGLVQLFRERAKELAGKTAVTPQELDHAAELAQQLVTAVGLKEQSPLGLTAAALLRQQAFTLFTQAYDEARRAIGYLRWHPGDGDTIAPSLWAGRGGRKAVEPEPTEPVVSPAPTDGTTKPSTGTATNTAPATTPAVGLPGATPFTQ